MPLWISSQCRLSNYIHTINWRRFKIVTFHLISLSCSLRTDKHVRSDVMNKPATWLLPRRHDLFSKLGLFIVSAHHLKKKEMHQRLLKWQHLQSNVQVERLAFNFTLQARHLSSPLGVPGNVLQFAVFSENGTAGTAAWWGWQRGLRHLLFVLVRLLIWNQPAQL